MKWSRFWQRQRRDTDLGRELDAYIEQEIEAQVEAGHSHEQAREAALRKLGNVTRIREDVYERESTRPGEADLIVAKHRNGPTRDLTVAFQGHYSRFVDMAHG